MIRKPARVDDEVREVSLLIKDARLPHPLGELLSSFVEEALNPPSAANYVLQRCRSSQNQQAELLSIVSDWTYLVESISQHGRPPPPPNPTTQAAITKRDGARCCITGKTGSFWDPLVVAPILSVPSRWVEVEERISRMLGAFFSPPYRDWWLDYIREPERMNPCRNHWLVRQSASCAFAKGLVRLQRLHPSMIEYEVSDISMEIVDGIELDGSFPLLGDHSRSGILKVDPRFTGTQARLAPSVQWINLAKNFARNEELRASVPASSGSHSQIDPQLRRWSAFSPIEILKNACLALWLMVPAKARVATYKALQKVGYRLYGPSLSATVQRLPFGLYLKYRGDPDGYRNEFNALQMVRRYTSIPVPRPLDVVSVPSGSELFSHDGYLLTSRIPGYSLSRCQVMMSDEDGTDFVTQMQGYITQLRTIPKAVNPHYAICNTLGEAIMDPRIHHGDPIGPFVDEAAFSQFLRYSDEPSRRGHRIFFTHADLNARNILVDRISRPDGSKSWKVTGIVDWEHSGYYPEYWDYTKSLFEGFRYRPRWQDFYHEIFKPFGDYSKELEVEERSRGEGGDVV